jgi:N-acyl amino acid synthase of PEP-CTERM/exosortase system
MSSIKVCLAESRDLLEQMHRLRYETYTTEVKSFDKDDFKDGLEIDAYDAQSVHIVALDRGTVVGTLRLVKDGPHGFVMETAFALPGHIDRTRVVEHSRGIVRKEYRDRHVYTKMLDYAYAWQRRNGYPICLGAPNIEKLHAILRGLGWQDIGEAKEYHNSIVVPMIYILT